MLGLQMDVPLMISGFLEHAARYHGDTEIVSREIDGSIHRYDYARAEERARQLAQMLEKLGVSKGDRVGSLAWNTHRHFELFYGVSGSGAVLHTVNPRLFEQQIAYVINHAEDKVLFIDAATLPIAERLRPDLATVKRYVMMCGRDEMPVNTALPGLVCYEDLIDKASGDYVWPEFDERSASSICYTSGTTGHPKGVVYSHRSAVLVTMLMASFVGTGAANGAAQTLMPMAPLFHGNGWQFPYLAAMTGARLVLPGRHYEPEMLYRLFEQERVTVACGVPTMWMVLTDWMEQQGHQFVHLRLALSSGSAPPRSLVEKFETAFGVEFAQAWGMAEVIGGSIPTLRPGSEEFGFDARTVRRMKSGRACFGMRYRLVDDEGREQPQDGSARGHLVVKSPFAASGYFKAGGGDALDEGGWLKTGDVARIDPHGHIVVCDRSKDVIKSGGEWISSVDLENVAACQPGVRHAAVIGVPNEKWQERPLLVVETAPGHTVTADELIASMRGKVASWWLPDRVEFIDAMPMTGTGKIHKPTLRKMFAQPEGSPDARPAPHAELVV